MLAASKATAGGCAKAGSESARIENIVPVRTASLRISGHTLSRALHIAICAPVCRVDYRFDEDRMPARCRARFAARTLKLGRPAFYERGRFGDEIGQRHGTLVAFAAGADADGAAGLFLIAEDKDIGCLLVGKVADLSVHLFVAQVGFDAQARLFQLLFDLLGIACVALADGHQTHLHGRKPQRECSGVVLDEHAEEALDRAEEGAVDHYRLMALAVFANVLELEARREIEVELNGGELPETAEHIDQLDVDLGAVEGGFAGEGLKRKAAVGEHLLQCPFGVRPVLGRAEEVAALLRIARGELDAILLEAEGPEHRLGEVKAGDDLAFDLFGRAEDMRVVLREAAHAQQAVHGARTLITINISELGVALRQIAVALGRVFVDENVARTVHRLQPVLGVVQLHRRKHVLGIDAVVAGDLPQLAAHDVGRIDQQIAAANALLAHPVLHDFANHGAFGMPEDEAGAGEILHAEEVQLLAQDAVIAAGGFLEAREVFVEILL